MRAFRAFGVRVVGLFRRSVADRELAEEFAAHLDMAAAEYERRGLSQAEARRRARLDSGNLALAAEAYRDQRGLPRIESLLRSLRHATRALAHSPGFATMAVLTLALGIGLATAVYTVADAMALRRLPVRDQGRIVVLWGRSHDGRFDNYPVAGAEDFVRQSRALRRAAYFASFRSAPIAVRDGATVSQLNRALVSGGFFGVLGANGTLGRALRPGDDAVGVAPSTVISYRVWQQ
ncbi:MAG: permease prefix domain 1-containing protein [Gemmatimonadaceae bacterium]